MGMIIIGVTIAGNLFYAYVIHKNKRQGRKSRSSVRYSDTPKVIILPEDIEREKRRRRIY